MAKKYPKQTHGSHGKGSARPDPEPRNDARVAGAPRAEPAPRAAATSGGGAQRLYLLHAHTPVHIGGDQGLSSVDLPTQREAHTAFPLIPGSSVKGVLRDATEQSGGLDHKDTLSTFGPPSKMAGDFRGGIVLTDALLLCLPVRSLAGTFAWVTCPLALRRLVRDLGECGVSVPGWKQLAHATPSQAALVCAGADGAASSRLAVGGRVFLEDYVLTASADPRLNVLASWLGQQLWRDDPETTQFYRDRLAVVSDDLFSFCARHHLEIRTRVKIDDATGTAAASGPWSEEHIPAETLMFGVASGRPTLFRKRWDAKKDEDKDQGAREPANQLYEIEESRDARSSLSVVERLSNQILRFGGKSSVGLGRARLVFGGAP